MTTYHCDKQRCEAAFQAMRALVEEETIDAFAADLMIVHARVAPDGIPYVDAWIQVGGQVYQPAMCREDGKELIYLHELDEFMDYIKAEFRVEYVPERLAEELEHHGHCGPWHPSLRQTINLHGQSTYAVNWHKPNMQVKH